ncbi:expressed unknown protein [Seminavis robusta]|uniref:Uncharacterized protein n=1 Tax=Seminavis robusta TaxID=568900 RepID=A0A9N8DXT2_9STRA|nr:expressed unknown protein [Seminavis robusta]|eukprot:Sro436_g142660.1 n/a (336) ;mRNA; f:36884-37891
MASVVVGEPPAQRQWAAVDRSTGIIEDEATAKRKLKEAGFDPNDCISAIDPPRSMKPPEVYLWHSITPMTYFCFFGDLPMCRYIHSHGGATTRAGREFWYPMYAAVLRCHLEICQFLFENGARVDVAPGEHSEVLTPLALCLDSPGALRKERLVMGKWLLVNGAIGFDANILANKLQGLDDNYARTDYRPQMLSWSQDVLNLRDCFQTFLMGTYVPKRKMDAHLGSKRAAATTGSINGNNELSQTQVTVLNNKFPVRLLGGNAGLLKCIAEYVGVVDGFSRKEMENHRRLSEVLPRSLRDFPFRRSQDNENDDGNEEDDEAFLSIARLVQTPTRF